MCLTNNEKRKTDRSRITESRKNLNAPRKGNVQILGNIENRHHQISGEERKKIIKEDLWRTRKLLETKLYNRHLIKRINTWAVLLVRYSGPFFKLTTEELQKIDQRTRKLMTMHKTLHPRNDID